MKLKYIFKLFFLLLFIYSGNLIAQRDSIGKVLDIGNNSDYEGYEILDSILAANQVIIAGEQDDYPAFNSKLEFKLLRYMNYKMGLRNYLVEVSQAKADLINQYISSEDSAVEKLLQSVSKVKYMRLYKNLKRLNAGIPDSLKIRVFGVEVEKSNSLPAVKMSQLLPEDSIPDNLRVSVEAIEGAAKYIITKGLEEYDREKEGLETDYDDYYYRPSAFSVSQSLGVFMSQYDSLKPSFESWLGKGFADFDEAVQWLNEYREYNRYSMTSLEYTWREEMVFNRVNELLLSHKDEKFFGQFGLCRSAYSRVPKGCGINNFGGLVYKLKNYPESACKNVVSIGIFYSEELDRDEDYMNNQHQFYKGDLDYLFSQVENDEATIVDPAFFDTLTKINTDFSMLILNHHFLLEEDEDSEIDTAYDGDVDYDEDDWYDNYKASRVYLGLHLFTPLLKLDNLNNSLKTAGFDSIPGVVYSNIELAIADDNAIGSVYFGQGRTVGDIAKNNQLLNSTFIGIKGGSAVVFKRFIKAGIFSNFSYVSHRITDNGTSTPQTFFVEYVPPKVYKNPAFVFGISGDIYIDISPFYLYGSAGRQWDWGKTNWRTDGKFTGTQGGLSNTAWFWNYGVGFSVPLRYLD